VTAQPEADLRRDCLYAEAATAFGAALERLARAYESDADRRLDLLQEIHVALWRSFAAFDGRCSVRTWVYRVAHNVATSQVVRRRRRAQTFVALDELDSMADAVDPGQLLDDRRALDRMMTLIHRLDPIDRQVTLLYLEGMDAASISEIAGISPGNVATKIHRVKKILARRFHEGTP
jgi:RNA polymerase sigma-70 factor (ECF subfamily)